MTNRTTLPQQVVGDLGTIKVDRSTLISPTKDTIASEENKKAECIVELFQRVGLSNMTTSGSHENRIWDLENSVTGAISPATTVMGETSFGLSPVVGTGSLYARQDHTHGTPVAPGGTTPASTVMGELTYGITPVVGTGSDYARHDHTHGTPPAINPAILVVGETTYGLSPAVGDSVAYARENHTHGSPPTAPPISGTAVISEQTYGQVPSPGISSSYAKEDHTHGTPSKYYPAFTELTDGPGTYSGAKGQIPLVNLTETGLEWVSGTTDFIDLDDVPLTYAGAASQIVAVKANEKGLEFISASAGVSPATTVMAETSYGLSPVVGTGSLYARQDHSHGSPTALGPATTVVPETSYSLSPSVGTGSLFARHDHTHGSPAPGGGGTPATTVMPETTYSLSPVVGTGSNYAREDHTHGSPASDAINPATTVMPETTYGLTPVVGTGSLYARHDHTHGSSPWPGWAPTGLATTVMSETIYGLSPVVGTGSLFARQDHTHGSPTTPSFLSLPDTPASYAGKQGMIAAVNTGETAVEFISSSAGSSPATTVMAETDYSLSPVVGTGSLFARQDHTHGSPTVRQDFMNRIGATYTSYYIANLVSGYPTGIGSYTAGTGYLMASPLIMPCSGTISEISMYVTAGGGAGSVIRIGIYKAKSKTDLYPGDLIQDCGTFSSVGVGAGIISGLSIGLTGGDLYWLAFTSNTTLTSVQTHSYTQAQSVLGFITSATTTPRRYIWMYNTFVYGVMPATYPGSPTWYTDSTGTNPPTYWYGLSS